MEQNPSLGGVARAFLGTGEMMEQRENDAPVEK